MRMRTLLERAKFFKFFMNKHFILYFHDPGELEGALVNMVPTNVCPPGA